MRGLSVVYLISAVFGVVVPLAVTIFVAIRVHGSGRGLAVAGLVLITASQLFGFVLNSVMAITGLGVETGLVIINTLSTLILTVGLVLVAIGLIMLTRSARARRGGSPMPYLPTTAYPTAEQSQGQQGQPVGPARVDTADLPAARLTAPRTRSTRARRSG